MEVTDNLLSQYIVDSGKLSDQELEAIRDYLSRNPEQLDIISNISLSMNELDMDVDMSEYIHPISVIPYTDEELAERYESNRKHALELLDEIFVEGTEQEHIANFTNQTTTQHTSQPKTIDISLDIEKEEHRRVAQAAIIE